jgi:Mg2+/Co2+ transporter CorB
MNFPLSFSDISLWLAVMAIITLITSELLFSSANLANITLNRKRMRLVALMLGTGFAVTVVMRGVQGS